MSSTKGTSAGLSSIRVEQKHARCYKGASLQQQAVERVTQGAWSIALSPVPLLVEATASSA